MTTTYADSVILNVTGDNILTAGASVPVRVNIANTSTYATIYDRDDAALSNPFNSDENGNYLFKVADGIYDIVLNEGQPSEYTIPDVEIGGEVDTQYDNVDTEVASLSLSEGLTIDCDRYYENGPLVAGLKYHIKTAAQAAADGDATGANTGNITLANGNIAVLQDKEDIYCSPAKYGANTTDDQTTLLNALLTVNRNYRSVLIDRPYMISSTSPNAAITVNDGEGLVTPKFNYHRVARGDYNGYLKHTGTGHGVEIAHSNGTSSPEAVELQNIVIHDSDGLGDRGLIITGGFAGIVAQRLTGACNGWDTGIFCDDAFFYSDMNWDCHEFRTNGAVFGGQINAGMGSGFLTLRLSSSQTTVDYGLSIGDGSLATQTTSAGAMIYCSIETNTGQLANVNLMQGGNLYLYCETPGIHADYNATAFNFNNLEGVDIHLGVSSKTDRGFLIANSRDCRISGYMEDCVNESGRIDSTCWGIDLSGWSGSEVVCGDNWVTGSIIGAGTSDTLMVREGLGDKGTKPNKGTWGAGSRLLYTDSSGSGNIGATVNTSGTEGTISQTCTGVSGTKLLTVSDTSKFSPGDLIEITSTAGTFVVNGFSGSDLIIDGALPSTVTAQTVSFVAPTYEEMFNGVQVGTSGTITTGSSEAITFPKAYSVAPKVVVSHNAGTSRDAPPTVTAITATGCTIHNWSTSSTSVTWFAALS